MLIQERDHEALLTMWNEEAIEEAFEARAMWLDDHGAKSTDVMSDELGDEYILVDNESGTSGDSYQIDSAELYLPAHLQTQNIRQSF